LRIRGGRLNKKNKLFLLHIHVHADGYEKGVQVLRQQHSEDMARVVQDIFSHYYITGRNALTIKLIVSNH
jgi:hypothetical protein